MNFIRPFHLAIPVSDLTLCRSFYTTILQCTEGRSSSHWVDLNFFGHQLVLHQKEIVHPDMKSISNPVDGKDVPVPHFGVILEWNTWEALADHLQKQNISFVVAPYIRFKGETGEQATLFFLDPEGNALEFKAFKHDTQIFNV